MLSSKIKITTILYNYSNPSDSADDSTEPSEDDERERKLPRNHLRGGTSDDGNDRAPEPPTDDHDQHAGNVTADQRDRDDEVDYDEEDVEATHDDEYYHEDSDLAKAKDTIKTFARKVLGKISESDRAARYEITGGRAGQNETYSIRWED